jgi:hypothetical protein
MHCTSFIHIYLKIQWVLSGSSPPVKQPEHEIDDSLRLRMGGAVSFTPLVCLHIIHRGNFTFTFYIYFKASSSNIDRVWFEKHSSCLDKVAA